MFPKRILDPDEVLEAMHAESLARCCDEMMEKYYLLNRELDLTQATTKEEFYGFSAADVIGTHYRKAGFGARLFYRLRDGRVIDSAARPHNPDPGLYDQTVH